MAFGLPLSLGLWAALAMIGGCVPSHVSGNEPAYQICHTDNCGDAVSVSVTNNAE